MDNNERFNQLLNSCQNSWAVCAGLEAIFSMSEADTAKAVEAIRADLSGDVDGANAALKAMSIEGLRAFTSILESRAAQRGIVV